MAAQISGCAALATLTEQTIPERLHDRCHGNR
jgi:hypothetical protein